MLQMVYYHKKGGDYMASYTCPSCGAPYNGKKCRACCYEHFSEEIAHGNHTHKGEPLVIDAPVRQPIPRKDPFGCGPKKQKRRKQKHPLIRFFFLLYMISFLLPMVRNWGLELERREQAAPEPAPTNLVAIHEEEGITISVPGDQLTSPHWEEGLRIWVENRRDEDLTVSARYVMVNGFVMPNASLYIQASNGKSGMGTLYLTEEDLSDAGIKEVQVLTFVLEGMDEDYFDVFVTDPITMTNELAKPSSYTRFDGPVLLEEEGLVLKQLGYRSHEVFPKFEDGYLVFYVENNTDDFLYLNSLETAIGETPVNLFLYADLPAHSRSVVRMDLLGLDALEFSTPSELEDLTMTVEFWSPENYGDSVREYVLTMPMTLTEPVVIS